LLLCRSCCSRLLCCVVTNSTHVNGGYTAENAGVKDELPIQLRFAATWLDYITCGYYASCDDAVEINGNNSSFGLDICWLDPIALPPRLAADNKCIPRQSPFMPLPASAS